MNRWLETHVRVNEWRAKYIGLFATPAVQRPTRHQQRLIPCISGINPSGVAGSRRKLPVVPTTRKKCLVFTSITMEPQQADDVTQLYVDNINQIRIRFP
jgi:hypothetical protein